MNRTAPNANAPNAPAAILLACLCALSGAGLAAPAPEAARRLAQDAPLVDTHIDAPGVLVDGWADETQQRIWFLNATLG